MILTPEQLHEIRRIIADHHDAFIVNAVGSQGVDAETLERLKKAGLINVQVDSAKDAYLYGQLAAMLQNEYVANMSYDEFKRHVSKNPIPLSASERNAVDLAAYSAGQYIRGLGNRVNTDTMSIIRNADRDLEAKMMTEVRTQVAENIARRESVRRIKSDLAWATNDWSRDWNRIAVTEKQAAMEQGRADHYRKRYGDDVMVAKIPMGDACKHCIRLHIGADGQPIIFRLADLEANGTNVGRKAAAWQPVVGTVHPHCQCQMVRVPAGWGFDEHGDLVPGGELGERYKSPEDLSLAMVQKMDLQKAFELQGRVEFQGLPIAIENQAGSVRTWKTPDGGTGSTTMRYAYGYVEGTNGADEDEIDVFLGPDPRAPMVYVVEQQNPGTGQYDEVKCMLGFANAKDAETAYRQHYDTAADFLIAVNPMAMDHFKRWIRKTMPAAGELMKAKYKRRWRGKDGKWRYEYEKPKHGSFTSPMVSPENQELDGSSYKKYSAKEMLEVTLDRVLAGKKPYGAFVGVEPKYGSYDSAAWVREKHAELSKNPPKGFVISPLLPGYVEDSVRFNLTRTGRLSDHFDMEALAEDYHRSGLPGIADHIRSEKHKKLSDYLEQFDFDFKKVHPWETGLVLGYPVENTMSRIYGVKMKKTGPARVPDYLKSDVQLVVPLLEDLEKAGPYIGPRGGKWADAAHTIPWQGDIKLSGGQVRMLTELAVKLAAEVKEETRLRKEKGPEWGETKAEVLARGVPFWGHKTTLRSLIKKGLVSVTRTKEHTVETYGRYGKGNRKTRPDVATNVTLTGKGKAWLRDHRGRKKKKQKPVYFASGSNHPGEIAGFGAVSHDLGVTADRLNDEGREALAKIAGTGVKVFLDSGAFSEVDFPKGRPPVVARPIAHEDWLKRLRLYKDMADELGDQLYAVAPDQVGNQKVTLERLERYMDQVKEVRAKGAHILVPIQKGELSLAEFIDRVDGIMGDSNYVKSIPMQKDATTVEDIVKLVQERRIDRIHFLGLGPESKKWPAVRAAMAEFSPDTQISSDSVALKAVVGRKGKRRALTVAQDEIRDELRETWNSEIAGLEPGDVHLDYTDEIYSPSEWITPVLKNEMAWTLSSMDFIKTEDELRRFKRDPDGWLQEHGNVWVDNILDEVWIKWAIGRVEDLDKRPPKLQGGEPTTTIRKREAIKRIFQAKAEGKPAQLSLFELTRAFNLPMTLRKAAPRGGKYIRRVPYFDKHGKRKYRYYYAESAIARDVQAGEDIRIGKQLARVEKVDEDGTIHLAIGDAQIKVDPKNWDALLASHYGKSYYRWAAKRAKQSANAVLRHVPKEHLEDLKGTTDAERLAELKERVPEVYGRLQKAFQRSGINPYRAKDLLTRSLERKNWEPEARAAVIGNVITKRNQFYRQTIEAAENLAGGGRVELGHVGAVTEIMKPPKKTMADEIKDVAASAEKELARLSALLAKVKKTGEVDDAAEVLAGALSSTAIQKLNMITKAFPGVKDRVAKEAREIMQEVPAVAPKAPPKSIGASTVVFVAGEGGKPKALDAKYKLMEAGDAIASHDPKTFNPHKQYPPGVQERAYHRDRSEQAKVLRNAQRMRPEFIINTNPDAVNGPPIMDKDGIVLGGNSRTMSIQTAYDKHPERGDDMRKYLAEHAHEVGFTPEDVAEFKNPILVRVVDEGGETKEDKQILVRSMNESFTQSMDPRTMQVAMSRKLSDRALEELGESMKPDETLTKFLGSSRAEGFIKALWAAGIIDERNSNQYSYKNTKQLNADGVQLVENILVGRFVQDADLMSNTKPKLIKDLAQSIPAMTQAKAMGKGYDLTSDLTMALDAYNHLQQQYYSGAIPALKKNMSRFRFDGLFSQMEIGATGGDHPISDNKRAMAMLEAFIRLPGPVMLLDIFKEYAARAKESPEAQVGSILGGDADTPEALFLRIAEKYIEPKRPGKEQPKAEEKPEAEPEPEGPGLFKSDGPLLLVGQDDDAVVLHKGWGYFVGPKGGKWKDPEHTIPWSPPKKERGRKVLGRPGQSSEETGDEPALPGQIDIYEHVYPEAQTDAQQALFGRKGEEKLVDHSKVVQNFGGKVTGKGQGSKPGTVKITAEFSDADGAGGFTQAAFMAGAAFGSIAQWEEKGKFYVTVGAYPVEKKKRVTAKQMSLFKSRLGGAHKYISRKKVKGKWVYTYPEDQAKKRPPKTPEQLGIPTKQLSLFDGIIENDPLLTPEQKAKPKSKALRVAIRRIDTSAEDPAEWDLPAGARVEDPWDPPVIKEDHKWTHPDYGTGTGPAPWHDKDWAPDLHSYHTVLINSSAGKDSQAMLSRVVEHADKVGYPRDKIVVVHADLGKDVEWEGTADLARLQAEHYGLRFEVVRREQNDLLGWVESRNRTLIQRQVDVGALLESGVATWADLTKMTSDDIRGIIDPGKGESDYDGRHRAMKMVTSARDKVKKLNKDRDDEFKKQRKTIASAEKAMANAKPGSKSEANAFQRKIEAEAILEELESLGPVDTWPIDFGRKIPWPSAGIRSCTSEHKRGPVNRLITVLKKEHEAKSGDKFRILNVMGMRAQESTGRTKLSPFKRIAEKTKKTVDQWLPLHRWHEREVWKTIDDSKLPYHLAYKLGMRRLSCVFCVMSPREDLMIAAWHNPEILKKYVELEEKTGATFTPEQSLGEIADEIKRKREEGFELNEFAEWVKKALGLDLDIDLIKAELERSEHLTYLLLEAALIRLRKKGKDIRTVTIEWKVTGACLHLDSMVDSYHVSFVEYPTAYNASLEAVGFANMRGLQVEEHNAPEPIPEVVESMEKGLNDYEAASMQPERGPGPGLGVNYYLPDIEWEDVEETYVTPMAEDLVEPPELQWRDMSIRRGPEHYDFNCEVPVEPKEVRITDDFYGAEGVRSDSLDRMQFVIHNPIRNAGRPKNKVQTPVRTKS